MRNTLLPLLALVAIAASTPAIGAENDLARRYGVEISNDDEGGPGEGGPWTSEGPDLPPCDYIDQGLDGSCTIGPDTPIDPPIIAPDECLYQRYYDDWQLFWPWACG